MGTNFHSTTRQTTRDLRVALTTKEEEVDRIKKQLKELNAGNNDKWDQMLADASAGEKSSETQYEKSREWVLTITQLLCRMYSPPPRGRRVESSVSLSPPIPPPCPCPCSASPHPFPFLHLCSCPLFLSHLCGFQSPSRARPLHSTTSRGSQERGTE